MTSYPQNHSPWTPRFFDPDFMMKCTKLKIKIEFKDVMRALEEVALSYDQKAEEAGKADELQKKLNEAEQKSYNLENVRPQSEPNPYISYLIIFANNLFILGIIIYLPFIFFEKLIAFDLPKER